MFKLIQTSTVCKRVNYSRRQRSSALQRCKRVGIRTKFTFLWEISNDEWERCFQWMKISRVHGVCLSWQIEVCLVVWLSPSIVPCFFRFRGFRIFHSEVRSFLGFLNLKKHPCSAPTFRAGSTVPLKTESQTFSGNYSSTVSGNAITVGEFEAIEAPRIRRRNENSKPEIKKRNICRDQFNFNLDPGRYQ